MYTVNAIFKCRLTIKILYITKFCSYCFTKHIICTTVYFSSNFKIMILSKINLHDLAQYIFVNMVFW